MALLSDRQGLIKPVVWLVICTLVAVFVYALSIGGVWSWVLIIADILVALVCVQELWRQCTRRRTLRGVRNDDG